MPAITVVVATAGRVALTYACLESIQKVSATDAVEVEMIVADSSSTSEQMQLQKICAGLGAKFLAGPPSISEKRILGAEHASYDNVLFVDQACVVAPGCIAAHLATLQDATVAASQGAVLFRGKMCLAFRAVRSGGILDAFPFSDGQSIRSLASGNLMVRREPLLAVRFERRLKQPVRTGEEEDFGLRLSEHDCRIVGTSAAIMYHNTAPWNALGSAACSLFVWGRRETLLIERHPDASYLDMPSPVLVVLLLSLLGTIAAWWSFANLLAIPVAFLSYAAFLTVTGFVYSPEDRLGGAFAHWAFFFVDLGRVWQSFRSARPYIALRRLQRTRNQITEEWQTLVLRSWAVWLMFLSGTVFMWWAIRR